MFCSISVVHALGCSECSTNLPTLQREQRRPRRYTRTCWAGCPPSAERSLWISAPRISKKWRWFGRSRPIAVTCRWLSKSPSAGRCTLRPETEDTTNENKWIVMDTPFWREMKFVLVSGNRSLDRCVPLLRILGTEVWIVVCLCSEYWEPNTVIYLLYGEQSSLSTRSSPRWSGKCPRFSWFQRTSLHSNSDLLNILCSAGNFW